MGRSLETGQAYEWEYRVRAGRPGITSGFSAGPFPTQAPTGKITRWFGTSTNIDAQKTAEEAVRLLESQYRLALDAADLGTWQIDLDKNLITWDEGSCALYHLPHNGLYSLTLEEALGMIHPDDVDDVRAQIATAAAPGSGGEYDSQYRAILPDGKLRWFRSHGQALYTNEGGTHRAISLYGVVSDITERHALEEAQKLLTRELNHRVKNLFAIANGMVSMTARTAKDPKDMANALRGRLSALSRAHELVQPVSAADMGAGTDVELGRLIEAVLEPYRQAGQNRITIEGPSAVVGSNTTTSLALVLHELATNAAKYGCLSSRWRACHPVEPAGRERRFPLDRDLRPVHREPSDLRRIRHPAVAAEHHRTARRNARSGLAPGGIVRPYDPPAQPPDSLIDHEFLSLCPGPGRCALRQEPHCPAAGRKRVARAHLYRYGSGL